jgi:hypothetical protein
MLPTTAPPPPLPPPTLPPFVDAGGVSTTAGGFPVPLAGPLAAAGATTSASPVQRRASARAAALSTYLRRLAKPQQMDFEYSWWHMLQLCVSPRTAYRHTSYHKQTKNQWARDDPAFVVACAGLLAAAAAAYCVTYGHSVWHALLSVVSAVAVDFLLIGAAVASACWCAR